MDTTKADVTRLDAPAAYCACGNVLHHLDPEPQCWECFEAWLATLPEEELVAT